MADGPITLPDGYTLEQPQGNSTLPPGYSVEGTETVQPKPESFWQATGIPSIIQSAKQSWADSQPIRDAEAKVANDVTASVKKGDFGTAAEILLNHLGQRGSQLASAAVKGAGENIKNAVMPEAPAPLEDYASGKKHPLANPITPIPGVADAAGDFIGEEVAARGPQAAGPSFLQKVVKGKGVAQEPAQESLKSAAKSGAKEAGASTVQPQSLRESLTSPIESLESAAKQNYQAIDEATAGKFQPNVDRLKNINNKLEAIAGTDDAKEAELMASKMRLEWQQEKLFDEAASKGVPKDVVDSARAQFKQAQALRDVQAKVFKNTGIVAGNTAYGTKETIDVDRAITALQKLQDNTEFGSPRLEQAFGKQGAKDLMNGLHAAQRQGVTAMHVQNIAKWVGGTVGAGAILKAIDAAATAGH